MAIAVTVAARHRADADALFAEAISFDELKAAMQRLATYDGLAPGTVAEEGQTYVVDIRFWGLFPVRGHTMAIERLDVAGRRLQSREHHAGIRQWDHLLSVEPVPEATGEAIWTDTVVIDAGWQTPFVARFAAYVYRHRHRARQALTIESRLGVVDLKSDAPVQGGSDLV